MVKLMDKPQNSCKISICLERSIPLAFTHTIFFEKSFLQCPIGHAQKFLMYFTYELYSSVY
jgi:hypothetical protein